MIFIIVKKLEKSRSYDIYKVGAHFLVKMMRKAEKVMHAFVYLVSHKERPLQYALKL